MVSAKVVPAVMSAEFAVTPAAAISIVLAAVTVAVGRVVARHINVGSRGVSIVFTSAMTTLTSMAMPVATCVGKLDVVRCAGQNLLRWG